ncbi:hypothetical protein F5Y16DRAFT_332760 [Xylariaceae sp. FL0255]|nr:hypothetical protein F5Y16DRAFT_332760 [Xylariaceae sp. FL0255]
MREKSVIVISYCRLALFFLIFAYEIAQYPPIRTALIISNTQLRLRNNSTKLCAFPPKLPTWTSIRILILSPLILTTESIEWIISISSTQSRHLDQTQPLTTPIGGNPNATQPQVIGITINRFHTNSPRTRYLPVLQTADPRGSRESWLLGDAP